ncbi:MAG: transposase, family [Eubacteriales bacterium]|nr:transposase, family [Eubacteriales bacterium]MDN5363756.1 transposase, family [Eubacteriales bacterium]
MQVPQSLIFPLWPGSLLTCAPHCSNPGVYFDLERHWLLRRPSGNKKIVTSASSSRWRTIARRSLDSALLALTERKTRCHMILLLPAKTAKAVDKAFHQLKERYGPIFHQLLKSITSDNGTEFVNLSSHSIDVYYTHPCSAWERATNERPNGLIRRFIPKGTAIEDLTSAQIERIQNWCSTLPRRMLGRQSYSRKNLKSSYASPCHFFKPLEQ